MKLQNGKNSILALFFLLLGVSSSSYAQDLKPWTWQGSDCQRCDILIVPVHRNFANLKTQDFAHAICDIKFDILKIYGSDPQEYNLLAQMALGILGRESRFFDSWRYVVKENAQWAVSVVKAARLYLAGDQTALASNSRGPTQIKVIPQRIADHYKITAEDLKHPRNAAKATMGLLIENLQELKRRANNNNWTFVTKETYVDYLPYVYFGAVSRLMNGTATPESNRYIQEMKRDMRQFQVFELPKRR